MCRECNSIVKECYSSQSTSFQQVQPQGKNCLRYFSQFLWRLPFEDCVNIKMFLFVFLLIFYMYCEIPHTLLWSHAFCCFWAACIPFWSACFWLFSTHFFFEFFICSIPWSLILKRHDLTARFQNSQMKWV